MNTHIPTPLHVENLSVSYEGRVALENVSLQVNHGELVGLIGPNGAGKTTLIRSILGLIRTDSGTIQVGGKTGKNAARSVGYVPQRHDFAWDFPLDVERVVLSGLTAQIGVFRRVKAHHWKRVYQALRHVHMEDMRERTIGKLSGGQRQRVLIARALATQPDILILDEPFTGLDQPTIDMLLELFQHLVDDGISIVMSTHDIAGAIDSCDRLIMINRTVRAQGAPSELLKPELWMETYQVSATSPLLRSIGLKTDIAGKERKSA